MEWRAAKYVTGGVDLEINHPALGWVPHTVRPGDDLWAEVTAGAVEPIDDAAELARWRAGAAMSRADFAVASAVAGHITETEAVAWASGTSIPATASAAIDAMDAHLRLAARVRLLTADTIHRNSDLIATMQAAYTLTDAQVDALFGGPE